MKTQEQIDIKTNEILNNLLFADTIDAVKFWQGMLRGLQWFDEVESEILPEIESDIKPT